MNLQDLKREILSPEDSKMLHFALLKMDLLKMIAVVEAAEDFCDCLHTERVFTRASAYLLNLQEALKAARASP